MIPKVCAISCTIVPYKLTPSALGKFEGAPVLNPIIPIPIVATASPRWGLNDFPNIFACNSIIPLASPFSTVILVAYAFASFNVYTFIVESKALSVFKTSLQYLPASKTAFFSSEFSVYVDILDPLKSSASSPLSKNLKLNKSFPFFPVTIWLSTAKRLENESRIKIIE